MVTAGVRRMKEEGRFGDGEVLEGMNRRSDMVKS